MKNNFMQRVVLVLSALTLIASTACKKNMATIDDYDNGALNTSVLRLQLENSALTTLDQEEIETLLYMREEEKLARDVYITLGNNWNVGVFNNISSAEQTHMDAVLLLLNKYGITDPIGNNGIGIFTNQNLQTLYNRLIAHGNTSLVEGFCVGAGIEDLDIYDLKNALTYINSEDLKLVYNNLTRASGNHLRAFYKNVVRAGGTYVPKYLTQSEFDSIINTTMQKGR